MTELRKPHVRYDFKILVIIILFFITFLHLYYSTVFPDAVIISDKIMLFVALTLVAYLWMREIYDKSYLLRLNKELIRAHGTVDRLMPYLHLPVQSGSDRVLAAMNRRHRADGYRKVVDRLRAARPDLALSSDFIVGFPGESNRDFADTLRLVTDVGFAQAYSFKYSPRPGTPAALMEQVPEGVKGERLAMLQTLLGEQQAAFDQATLGRVLPVLFERKGRRGGQLVGRSPYMQAVHATAPQRLLSRIVDLRIDRCHPNSLAGTVVTEEVVGVVPATDPAKPARVLA